MSARQSSATDHALKLIHGGVIPAHAARAAGIALSTVYRSLKRQRQQAELKKPPG